MNFAILTTLWNGNKRYHFSAKRTLIQYSEINICPWQTTLGLWIQFMVKIWYMKRQRQQTVFNHVIQKKPKNDKMMSAWQIRTAGYTSGAIRCQ